METPRNVVSTSLALSYATTARRTFPLRRTPFQRRIAEPKPLSASPTGPSRLRRSPANIPVRHPGDFPGLTNKTWQVYYLSPLYKFSIQVQAFRQYTRSLAAYLAQGVDKQIAVDKGCTKECEFSIVEGLRINAVDPEAVQILVTNKTKNGSRTSAPVLTAILCGLDLESNPCAGLKRHFTYYPLLLVKSTVGLTSLLIAWLQSHFDCRIAPLVPSSMDLAWMVAMWSGLMPEKRPRPVELLYSVPAECQGLKHITYTIDAADSKALWDSIRNPDSEEFTGEEVGAFIKSLEEHFYECFKIKLWKMQLARVGTAVVYVGDGRVKIFSAEHAWHVLRLLSELALEQFQTLAVQ